jgi:hypothetical protein
MAIDPRYIPAFSIEDVLLDKDTGAPLTGGLVYFEHDNQRGVLKPVYQITGTSPDYTYTQLPNPMELSSIGTFEDSLSNPTIPYFFPYDSNGDVDLYYIRVTSSEDVPQFTRQAQPYLDTGGDNTVSSAYENEISNPQFAEVLFDTSTASYVYNFNAASQEVVSIAPDWDIVVSCAGAGTVTVSQLAPVGSLNILTNPGTILNINSAGLSRLRLRQRLYGSPNLWGSGYLAGSFVAKTYSGTDVTLTLYYSQSDGTVTDQAIVTATLLSDGVYAAHPGSVLIPASTSTEFFPDAYVDIEFDLPLSVNIDITSVMVAMTGAVSVDDIIYDQETQNRQIDHLFHYYKPQLEFKPIPSLLVGWDFPLNPAQTGSTVTMNTTAAYIWDQVISKTVVGNIAVARSGLTSGFQATTANNSEAFYMCQYLDGAQAREILGTKLAVNVNAFRTQAGGAVTCKVYLYRGGSGASFPVLPTGLGNIGAAGDFTLTAAAWTLIPRGNLGQASGTLSTVNTGDYTQLNDVEDLKFNGWEIDDSTQISDTDKFAIVVTFSCPTTGTVVTVDSISLVKGDIATRPAPQSPNEVLTDCQYYYEKSYAPTVTPGTTNAGAALYAEQLGAHSGGNNLVYPRGFGWPFKAPKRTTAPVIQFYSPVSGTSASVRIYLKNNAIAVTDADLTSGRWTQQFLSATGVSYIANSVGAELTTLGADSVPEGYIIYHYTINARLGEVA